MSKTKVPTATHTWSNKPGVIYPAHSHPYLKTLYCVQGSIEFRVHNGNSRKTVTLRPGDKLDLPPKTLHSALVGSGGVTCIETHQY